MNADERRAVVEALQTRRTECREVFPLLDPSPASYADVLDDVIDQIADARVKLAVRLAEEAVRAEMLELVDARVTAALEAVASHLDEIARTPRMWMAYPEAARIVRAAIPPPP